VVDTVKSRTGRKRRHKARSFIFLAWRGCCTFTGVRAVVEWPSSIGRGGMVVEIYNDGPSNIYIQNWLQEARRAGGCSNARSSFLAENLGMPFTIPRLHRYLLSISPRMCFDARQSWRRYSNFAMAFFRLLLPRTVFLRILMGTFRYLVSYFRKGAEFEL
jgi:hypothetical protein